MVWKDVENFFLSKLKRRRVVLKRTWFQQSRITSHTTNSVIQCLKQKFGDRLIVRHTSFSWPPRKPDLIPCDFFLRGHLKANLFSTRVPDLLTSQILAEIGKIWKTMLWKIYENALFCFRICIGNDDHYLSNVILKICIS